MAKAKSHMMLDLESTEGANNYTLIFDPELPYTIHIECGDFCHDGIAMCCLFTTLLSALLCSMLEQKDILQIFR